MTAVWRVGASLGAAGFAVLIGVLVAFNPQVALVAALILICAAALAAPASRWAIAALIAALTFHGLVSVGVLPSVATYVDIALAWGALAAALLRTTGRGDRPDWARKSLHGLAALGIVMVVSWGFSDAEPLRPVLYFALLAQPFALIIALVLDPPSPRARRALQTALLALVLVQIPIAYWQATAFGFRDPVQGTLYGAGAGAHTMAAVVTVGAIWIALTRRYGYIWRYTAVILLATIPFIADAKQVIFALPAVLIVGRWRTGKDVLVRVAAVAGALAALLFLLPAGRTSVNFLEEARSGQGGKEQAAKLVWDTASRDPASLIFGQGPAETVSRAAFMTTDLFLSSSSPLRALELRPAQTALQAQDAAVRTSGGGSSFNSGLSSALGVFGDLGVAGLVAFLGLLGSVLLAVRKTVSPEGIAASAGFALFAVLGLVFDWWEQPPFSVVLAVLAGLALSQTRDDDGSPARGVSE